MTNTDKPVRLRAQYHSHIHQHLAAAAATTLVLTSAGLGAYAGWQFGAIHSTVLAVGLAVAALAGEALKPFAVAGTIEAAGRLDIPRALGCFVIAMACVAYSLAGHLLLASTARSDFAAIRSAEGRTVADAWRERDRTYAELKAIGTPRSPAELKPLINSATKLAGDCTRIQSATQREACKRLPQLHAEAATHDRKAQAEKRLVASDQQIQQFKNHSEKVADPLATALAAYAKAAGQPITAEQIGPFLALIPVMLLEFGSVFAVVATRRRQEWRPVTLEPIGSAAMTPAPTTSIEPVGPKPTASVRDAIEKITALTRERGGTLTASSKREVARLIDASPPTASRALAAMAGVAAVSVDQSNIVVKLLG